MPYDDFRFSGYLEQHEVRAVINAIPLVSGHADRDILLIELLWQSGARVSEVLPLTPNDIGMTSVRLINLKQRIALKDENGVTIRDENHRIVKVHDPDATKEVEISAELCTMLRIFCEEKGMTGDRHVFQGNRNPDLQLSRWYVWYLLNKASEKAQIRRFGKKNRKTKGRFKGAYPHLLRHSNAMFLLDHTDNIDLVREHLGHASVVTTQGYARVKEIKMKETIREIEW